MVGCEKKGEMPQESEHPEGKVELQKEIDEESSEGKKELEVS